MAANRILIIQHGDLTSLAAAGVQNSARDLVLWHPRAAEEDGGIRQRCVERLGALLHVHSVELGPEYRTCDPDDPQVGLESNLMLLHAIEAARKTGCRRVIWPHQVGPDFEAVSAAVERAEQIAALAAIGQGHGHEVTIDLPLIDLSDPQVVEVAADSGLALSLFWPGGTDEQRGPDPTNPTVQRWYAAFRAAEIDWPWSAVTADSTS